MKRERWQVSVQKDYSYIFNVTVDRIQKKHSLHPSRKTVHRVEYRGHVHQQGSKYLIQILRIPEKHKHGREDQSHPQVEHRKRDDRINNC